MKLFDLENRVDVRGNLTFLESGNDLPFECKRVFYIYNVPSDIERGGHAHLRTNQFLVAVAGTCSVTLQSDSCKKTFRLDNPREGLLQQRMVWGTMHDFSRDCVLLVLASEIYSEDDYVHDYARWRELVSS